MFSIPNLLTSLNLACGLGAIISGSAYPIFFSVFFDAADGWIARKSNRETTFGAYFDSVADFISFGLAPAILFGAPMASSIYVAACAYRLVRFHQKRQNLDSFSFQGLPTTAAGFVLAVALSFGVTAWILPVLSALMISRIPFSKFRVYEGYPFSRRAR